MLAHEAKQDVRTRLPLKDGGRLTGFAGMHKLLVTACKNAMNQKFPIQLYHINVYPRTVEEEDQIAAKAFIKAIKLDVFSAILERWKQDPEFRAAICRFVSASLFALLVYTYGHCYRSTRGYVKRAPSRTMPRAS